MGTTSSVNWHYKELGLNREQAEQKILSIGGKICLGKGFEFPVFNKKGNPKTSGARIHLVYQSNESFHIHEDTSRHHVRGGKKAKNRCLQILNLLIKENK